MCSHEWESEAEPVQRLVNGVVGADGEFRPDGGYFSHGIQHQPGHAVPIRG